MIKKSFVLWAFVGLFLVSCGNSSDEAQHVLPSSIGTTNRLSVIVDDSLWKGDLGGTVRDVLAAPVAGLPQEEPLFTLGQIPPEAFGGFTLRSRIFLKISPKPKPYFKIVQDTFARPQTGIFVGAQSIQKVQQLIKENSEAIISAFKRTELQADQRRIAKSLESTEVLEKKFGLTMNFPSAYRYAKEEGDFVWIRKDIPHGSMEMMIYEVPMAVIDKGDSIISNIVKMRDSVGKRYIPGPREGTYMITEKAYAPFLTETTVDGKFTYVTKGNWTVKDAFMAGPFINYAIRDKANNRYLILEGFVFKPQAPTKRNNIFEFKAIFKSAQIK